MKHRKMLLGGAALVVVLGTTPAWAAQQSTVPGQDAAQDSPDASQLDEIVVTAQRRSQNLQEVPIVVAVATAEELQNSGITGVSDLKVLTPGVEVQSNNAYALPVVRGVGSKATGPGIESPIAIYVDDVYYANPGGNLLSFNNIAQVEVLKGPQGTLFGRNATGGLIQVTTRDPRHEFGGEATVSYGNYETLRGELYVTGGLTENWAIDLAAQGTTMGDGYGTNLFNGHDVYKIDHDWALRSKSLITFGHATDMRVILDYSETENNMNATRPARNASIAPPFGPSFAGRAWDVDLDQDPKVEASNAGISVKINHDFGPVRLASITAYRQSDLDFIFDIDYTRVRGRTLQVEQADEQFSQEIQLLSPEGSRLDWQVGAYFFDATAQYDLVQIRFIGPAAIPTVPPTVQGDTFSRQETKSIAGFGQATYALTDRLNVTGGLRFTHEERTLADAYSFNTLSNGATVITAPLSTRSETFEQLTWRLALDYQLADDVLAYVSYNRGFKSGGFNPSSLTIAPFRPEVLDAYEVGLKSTLFDRRVRLNGSAYYYDYKDTQLQRAVSGGSTGIYNSTGAELYGVDLEIQAQLTSQFNLSLGYQYAQGEYKDFPGALIAVPLAGGGFDLTTGNAVGNTTVLTPEHTFSAAANYTVDIEGGEINANVSFYYNDGFYPDPDNVIYEPSYSLINASLRWQSNESGLSAMLFAANLTNEEVTNINGFQQTNAGINRVNYAPPRTYGVKLGYSF